MLDIIGSIFTLSESRLAYLLKHGSPGFFHGSQTFMDGIRDEIGEVETEMKENNHVYLEDELGDVFWDYLCLLENLEREGKITKSRVFERCYKKFSERILPDGSYNGNWKETKERQKEELKKEHNKHYS